MRPDERIQDWTHIFGMDGKFRKDQPIKDSAIVPSVLAVSLSHAEHLLNPAHDRP